MDITTEICKIYITLRTKQLMSKLIVAKLMSFINSRIDKDNS